VIFVHHPHQIVERDLVAGRHAFRHGLVADARVTQLLLRILGIHPEDVE
jgi:hypothetical protein